MLLLAVTNWRATRTHGGSSGTIDGWRTTKCPLTRTSVWANTPSAPCQTGWYSRPRCCLSIGQEETVPKPPRDAVPESAPSPNLRGGESYAPRFRAYAIALVALSLGAFAVAIAVYDGNCSDPSACVGDSELAPLIGISYGLLALAVGAAVVTAVEAVFAFRRRRTGTTYR